MSQSSARPVVKLFKVLGLNVTQEFVEDAPDRRRLVRDLARRLPRPTPAPEGPTMTDTAGLCERLRGDLPFHEDDGAVNECAVYARLTEAADTLERQAAEIDRLRGVLLDIADESESADVEGLRGFARAALTGEES